MKRCPQLQKLSREHHPALTLALRLKRDVASGDAARIAAGCRQVRELFASELTPHFVEEEERLLPALAAVGADALVKRTLDEHGEIRRIVDALATPDAGNLLRFAELIAAHVRFEERELFEAAQTLLDDEAFARLAH